MNRFIFIYLYNIYIYMIYCFNLFSFLSRGPLIVRMSKVVPALALSNDEPLDERAGLPALLSPRRGID